MLSKAALSLLPTSAAAPSCAISRLGPALTRAFAAQGDKEDAGESSYQRMKNVASQSGDPAKEWMAGAKEQASAYAQSAEQLYEATKRATQDVTTHAKETIGRAGLKDVKQMASDATKGGGAGVEGMAAGVSKAAGAAGEKLSDAAQQAAEAVKGAVGDPYTLPSARAEFEKSRSEEVKAAENADRKSQLTDEATTGDNPLEQRTRDEHEILENEFYGKH